MPLRIGRGNGGRPRRGQDHDLPLDPRGAATAGHVHQLACGSVGSGPTRRDRPSSATHAQAHSVRRGSGRAAARAARSVPEGHRRLACRRNPRRAFSLRGKASRTSAVSGPSLARSRSPFTMASASGRRNNAASAFASAFDLSRTVSALLAPTPPPAGEEARHSPRASPLFTGPTRSRRGPGVTRARMFDRAKKLEGTSTTRAILDGDPPIPSEPLTTPTRRHPRRRSPLQGAFSRATSAAGVSECNARKTTLAPIWRAFVARYALGFLIRRLVGSSPTRGTTYANRPEAVTPAPGCLRPVRV